jgi:hypothetical protein
MLKLGGFNLTKWVSNRLEVVTHLPTEDRAQGFIDLDFDFKECEMGRHK